MDLNELFKEKLFEAAPQAKSAARILMDTMGHAAGTVGQDAGFLAGIINDPRNSWIGNNPLGKVAAGGIGMAGMLLGQLGKHELPAVGMGMAKQAEGQTAKNYKNWFEQVGIRHQQEQMGQGILDDMEEIGRTPKQVVADFWQSAYPQLSPEAQERFHRMIKNQTGMSPGGVLYVDKTGNRVTAKGWHEVYDPDLPPPGAGDLEGTERGLIALMEMANQRFAKTGQKGRGPGLEDGKTINIIPR